MSKLKDLLAAIDDEDESPENEIEVFADSVKQALELASKDLGVEISSLDYDILVKGTKGVLGMGRQPYRVLVRQLKVEHEDKYGDLEELDQKLSRTVETDIEFKHVEKTQEGKFKVRVTRTGIWLTVTPASPGRKAVESADIQNRLLAMRVTNADLRKIEKEVRSPSSKPVKVGDWIPNPEYDGSLTVEVSEDEMKVFVHFVPPRFSGSHLEVDDVVSALKRAGVLSGIQEQRIRDYLDQMDYSRPLLAAEGMPPRHGKDAFVDYKVRVNKNNVSFSEDEKGQVDFKNLDLLENVVVGQILAVKVPAQQGIPGRSIANRILPARSGKDTPFRYGKGTILSEDGTELSAEINGQVVFLNGKISVEPVYVVKGDVSLETGNVVFLGSVVIGGNVQDNFVVKAAGNIEVKGSVGKAFLEAEGDIIVRQGMMGREEAKIESTGGSVYANFIQSCHVYAEKDVIASEGILHSHVDAVNRVLCHGKRARVVGGVIRAGDEVNASVIGADSFTKTEVRVGINPKVLQQISDMENVKKQVEEDLEKLNKDITTLNSQKLVSGGKLPPDKLEMLQKLTQQKEKGQTRVEELKMELEELKEYLGMLEQKGKVCAEKVVYPGVEIYIKDKRFAAKDPYNHIKFSLEGGEIKLSEYEKPEISEEVSRIARIRKRR
ncbi:MAG: DUF342 domain-containing protein [Spirochaetes bacterium]|nr:MAG: DUF342 domain-containing protein [Spirochaetota bacterium]